ncbi:MAG: SiaC family regulatory phosphoprotein [Bacteroidota bacterium]
MLHLEPTNKTPEVTLNPKGIIKITGRAIDESRNKFSEEIISWLDDYLTNPANLTEVVIALEYLNSYNSIIMATILRQVAQVMQQAKKLSIKWYIDEDDDDLLERGKYISSTFNIPIDFIMTEDIKSMY